MTSSTTAATPGNGSAAEPPRPNPTRPAAGREQLRQRAGQLVVAVVVAAVGVGFGVVIGLNLVILAALVVSVLAAAGVAQVWRERRGKAKGSATVFALNALAAAALSQLIPAGREHTNPAVTAEPQWADPQARELMVRACYGCHSNEVDWPWYSNVAPLSWAISDHVTEGRKEVNYSEFDQSHDEADETIEVLLDGSMPPSYYTRFGLHADAERTAAEVDALGAWLRQTPGLAGEGDEGASNGSGDGEEHDEDDED